MKSLFKIICYCLLANTLTVNAQKFDVDTLQYQGTTDKVINLVILSDGYTQEQLGQFAKDAANFNEYLFSQSPYSHYRGYFNVFIIKVPSLESGVKHAHNVSDCPVGHGTDTIPTTNNQVSLRRFVPKSNPNNYFGSSFDNSGIHRLVVAKNQQAIKDVLKENFPEYTQTIILANSPYYGGSGGVFPTATVNMASNAIAIHEIGHSFANLADEYWAGLQFLGESVNQTQYASITQVPWKRWLGTAGIGVFAYGGKEPNSIWFRPSEFCKMQYLIAPFCSVCSETIIEKIHTLTNPILTTKPLNKTPIKADSIGLFSLKLAKPDPNTLKIEWSLNGELITSNIDSIWVSQASLKLGNNELMVKVRDTSLLVRADGHNDHVSEVKWLIDNDRIRDFNTPTIRWGASIVANYGKPTALTIKSPEAGVIYRWYNSIKSKKAIGSGTNFITEPIFDHTTYFLEASWKKRKSTRASIVIKPLPEVTQPQEIVSKNIAGDSILISIQNPDKKLNYKWYASESDIRPINGRNGIFKMNRNGTELRLPASYHKSIFYVQAVSTENSSVSSKKKVELIGNVASVSSDK